LVACLLCGFVLVPPATADALTYGPTVTPIGIEQAVFDYTTDHCAQDEWDIPDQAARAFKDDLGRVQLHFSHMYPRRNIGPDLDTASSVGHHDCKIVSNSNQDSDSSHFDDLSWLSAPYTIDGHTIYSLVHEEYRGWNYGCQLPPDNDTTKCWYNAITLETSTNSGELFTHVAAPGQLVASQPYTWVDGTGPYGLFTPSNIIKKHPDDGYYYDIVRSKQPGGPDISCLMRTNNLGSAGSWRAWGDGPDADAADSFEVQFVNPYTYTFTANDTRDMHECKDIGGGLVSGVSESLTYNSYFGKYIIVGAYGDPVPGFFYSLSDDLIHWSYPKLLAGAETAQSWQCGDPDPVRDPSLLDPTSTGRNFETTGQRPYLYYTIIHNNGGCGTYFGPDRDEMRVQVEFNNENAVPNASFTLSPNPAQPGQSVFFNGLSSSDPDGTILKYEWDLDGNGTYETDTGSTPTVSHSYATAGTVTVGLRVTDDNGGTGVATRTLTIKTPASPPVTPSTTPTTTKQTTSSSDPACASVRTKKRRLQLLLTSIRRDLARAKSAHGKRHYRLRIASVKRQIKRLAHVKCRCPATRKKGEELDQRLQTARNNWAAAQTLADKTRYQREIRSLKLKLRRLGDACICADKRKKRTRFQKQLDTAQQNLGAATTGAEKNRYEHQIKALKRKIQRLRCSR
jgi:YD repeat-containing protein